MVLIYSTAEFPLYYSRVFKNMLFQVHWAATNARYGFHFRVGFIQTDIHGFYFCLLTPWGDMSILASDFARLGCRGWENSSSIKHLLFSGNVGEKLPLAVVGLEPRPARPGQQLVILAFHCMVQRKMLQSVQPPRV